MQLKKLMQVILISCGIAALSACALSGKDQPEDNNAAVTDANGAQTAGANDTSNFNDEQGQSPDASLTKRTYYFDFDRSQVHEEDKAAIFANADYLVAHSDAKIIVEGHTDPRGSREYNVALGEHRANAVVELLKSKGVNASQIRVVSYGAERLAAPGHSEEDYQKDRRAIIVYEKN